MQLSTMMDPRREDKLKYSENYITQRLRECTDFAESYVKQLDANDLKKVVEYILELLHIRRNKQARVEEDFVITLQYLLYPFHSNTISILIQDRSPEPLLALSWLFRIQGYETTLLAKVQNDGTIMQSYVSAYKFFLGGLDQESFAAYSACFDDVRNQIEEISRERLCVDQQNAELKHSSDGNTLYRMCDDDVKVKIDNLEKRKTWQKQRLENQARQLLDIEKRHALQSYAVHNKQRAANEFERRVVKDIRGQGATLDTTVQDCYDYNTTLQQQMRDLTHEITGLAAHADSLASQLKLSVSSDQARNLVSRAGTESMYQSKRVSKTQACALLRHEEALLRASCSRVDAQSILKCSVSTTLMERSDTCARLQAELHDKEAKYCQARDRVEKNISALKSKFEDLMEQAPKLIPTPTDYVENIKAVLAESQKRYAREKHTLQQRVFAGLDLLMEHKQEVHSLMEEIK